MSPSHTFPTLSIRSVTVIYRIPESSVQDQAQRAKKGAKKEANLNVMIDAFIRTLTKPKWAGSRVRGSDENDGNGNTYSIPLRLTTSSRSSISHAKSSTRRTRWWRRACLP